MYSYRITKYNPAKRLSDGTYMDKEEWTSFTDEVQLKDYMQIEDAYVYTIIHICNLYNIQFLIIKELEINIENCNFKNNQKVKVDILENLVRMILREQIWCKLVSKQCEFHFGYDYYMYFVSYSKPLDISIISPQLYVEDYQSPYI